MISTDIRIVLVEPSHPGNIGAVARAMKNMALDQLVLVKPKQFPHSEATARASGADDVLANARVVGSVREALAGCGFVAATTSRDRDQYFRVADVRDAAERIAGGARGGGPEGVVFLYPPQRPATVISISVWPTSGMLPSGLWWSRGAPPQ